MSKILEHGNTYKVCACKICKCRFEYSEIDTHEYLEQRDYIWQKPRWKAVYVYCPECGKKNVVESTVFNN